MMILNLIISQIMHITAIAVIIIRIILLLPNVPDLQDQSRGEYLDNNIPSTF
jgi:hypothetical protein